MNVSLIFIFLVLGLILLIYIGNNFIKTKLIGFSEDKSLNIIVLLLISISIITLISVIIGQTIKKSFYTIEPSTGDRGERGDRGNVGEDSKCGLGCNDDAGYRKVMSHITNVYNLWCTITGNKLIPEGRYIENDYIKMKVKENVTSQTFSDLLQKDGAHKMDARGKPLAGYDKCDINSNCGAYDYIFQKWTEWILILLKYKNGNMFINSKNMDDNDFNSLLSKEDIDISNSITKEWIFKIIDPATNDELNMFDILHPKENTELLKTFRKTDFYDFYISNGVPDTFKVINNRNKQKLKSPTSKLLASIKSPFEEISDYDCWYWGANPLSEPKLINKCSYDVTNEEKDKKHKLKVKLCNDYDIIWESKNARQERINYTLDNSKPFTYVPESLKNSSNSKLVYVPNNLKGDRSVVVLRPNIFTDISERNLNFKTYYPVGDVIADEEEHKSNDNQCYPRLLKSTYDSKPVDYNKNGPKKLTLLVAGDVKSPMGYKQIYQGLREKGFFVNKLGYTFWRPIPPAGYVSLGDIIDVSPIGKEPSINLIKCIPEECVEVLSNYDASTLFNTRDISTSFNGISNIKLQDSPNSESETIDTDRVTEHATFLSIVNNSLPAKEFNENDENNIEDLRPFLSNYNVFRGSNYDGKEIFYKIKEECLYDDINLNQTFKDTIIKKPKFSEKYSILKIYDE